MQGEKKTASIPQKARRLTVAPSPYNAIKFELGVILLLTPVCWLLVDRLVRGAGARLLLLALFGVTAALWLVLRARRVQVRHGAQQAEGRR